MVVLRELFELSLLALPVYWYSNLSLMFGYSGVLIITRVFLFLTCSVFKHTSPPINGTRYLPCATRSTPHVPRHTSLATCHSPLVPHHLSHTTRPTPHVPRYTSHATRPTPHVASRYSLSCTPLFRGSAFLLALLSSSCPRHSSPSLNGSTHSKSPAPSSPQPSRRWPPSPSGGR